MTLETRSEYGHGAGPVKWVKKILLNKQESYVMNNWYTSGYFKRCSGERQGDGNG